MYSRVLAMFVVVMAVSVAVGCGGGSGQQSDQSQGSGQEDGSGGKDKEAESLDGTVARVLLDRDTVVVRPEDGQPVPFRYKPEKVKVSLNGEDAGPEDIEKGQSVSVRYVTRTTEKGREVNTARSIKLQSRDSGESGGETTG